MKRHPFTPSVGPRHAGVVAFVVWCSLLAGSTGSAAPSVPDPLQPGPYPLSRIEYDAAVTVVQSEIGTELGTVPGHAYPERLRGTLHFPKDAPVPFPAIVFLHGRHGTCWVGDGEELLVWPCPDAPPIAQDLPSWRGFDYLGANLASHGYVVMSINANGINMLGSLDGTPERVQLLERSLGLLGEWNQGARALPDGVGRSLAGRIDLTRIGLMGHSRGGAAVEEFLERERERTDGPRFPGVRAILALQTAVNLSPRAPAGVHFGAIVTSCDGDAGVEGALDWDRGRFLDANTPYARVQFSVTGASHNWFNSEWPDEWDETNDTLNASDDDEACSHHRPNNVRLTRADQEKVGIVLINGFFRRYVGREVALDPLMTGAAALPTSACPKGRIRDGQPVPCAEIVKTSYLGPAAERRMILLPRPGGTTTDDGGSVSASGLTSVFTCGGEDGACPEPDPGFTLRSAARQLRLVWDGPAVLRAELGIEGRDVSRFRSITFRTSTNPWDPRNGALPSQDLEVVLMDADGEEAGAFAADHSSALVRPPANDLSAAGPSFQRLVLNGVRIPLSAYADIDLSRVAAVELRFGERTKQGSIQLAELAFQELAGSAVA